MIHTETFKTIFFSVNVAYAILAHSTLKDSYYHEPKDDLLPELGVCVHALRIVLIVRKRCKYKVRKTTITVNDLSLPYD